MNYDLDFHLISIQKNFVNKDDEKIMQYYFCFNAIYDGDIQDEFKCLDNKNQTFYWVNLTDLSNYNIVPNFNIDIILDKNNYEIKYKIYR